MIEICEACGKAIPQGQPLREFYGFVIHDTQKCFEIILKYLKIPHINKEEGSP